MVKIAFQTPQIDVRGTCNAVYSYAHYNEIMLGNKSIIVVPSKGRNTGHSIANEYFLKRFNVYFYDSYEHLEKIISDCDIIYFIKYGNNDDFLSCKIKNVIHCVFDMSNPHGDVFAGVSEELAKKFNKSLFVPHIVSLEPSKTNENLRLKLNIPEDATVFGYHGGCDAFNIDFVKNAIKKIIRENNNIYFIFINIPRFDEHPNIKFMDMIIEPNDKNKFICTCDAMIHAQVLGESFGLSIAEFSINNKPVITYSKPLWNINHIKILGDKGIYYENEQEIYNIFKNFNKNDYKNKDLNCYKQYTPDKVMTIFKKVFID